MLAEDADAPFDAITELWFEDQSALDAFQIAVADPIVLARAREDESNFLDASKTRGVFVDESTTAGARLTPS